MIKNFIDKNHYEYLEEASLRKYNTYRVDALAKYVVFPHNKEEFASLILALDKEKYKYIVLGNGSNVIFNTTYYDGVVILLTKLNSCSICDGNITVGAGYSLQKLAIDTASRGLVGLEFATGIPGLVGASIAMNAGAYKSEISSVVESVLVLNPNYEFVLMHHDDLDFSYRNSFFKENKGYYIVEATLKVEHGNPAEILERVSKRRVKRIESQPLDMPSAGSVFRNPPSMFAGELIEKVGLKGYAINGAMVSEKHANFIVNKGNARGEDIVRLIHMIQDKVQEEFGVLLVLEQIIVN